MTVEKLIHLYEPTPPTLAVCRGCGASIVWHDTLRGARMPMNAGAVARKTERDPVGRTVGLFAAADAHWMTCPSRDQFARGNR